MASLRELEDALNDAGPTERTEGQTQSSNLHQECLYYLNAYGTHLALISFYMRHDCMIEALTFLFNKVRPRFFILQWRGSAVNVIWFSVSGVRRPSEPASDFI